MKISKAKDRHQSAAMQSFDSAHWLLPNDDSMGFVKVAAGTFLMGSNDISVDEGPLHLVNLPEFWISKYPVTVAQFRAFAEECGEIEMDAGISLSPENHPVVFVSWVEALKYCEWLTTSLQ
jgi:formylglycine-generating enzyme required for sulfatase activity